MARLSEKDGKVVLGKQFIRILHGPKNNDWVG